MNEYLFSNARALLLMVMILAEFPVFTLIYSGILGTLMRKLKSQ